MVKSNRDEIILPAVSTIETLLHSALQFASERRVSSTPLMLFQTVSARFYRIKPV